MFSLAAVLLLFSSATADNWDYWWTYEGFSGPEFWGVINPEYTMCSKGRSQSPVNINPGNLETITSVADLNYWNKFITVWGAIIPENRELQKKMRL